LSENSRRVSPTIFGLKGTAFSDEEAGFFHAARPWGVILFARNIESRDQLRQLTGSLRDASGNPHLPILIDQEGGRVARLRPPLVRDYPAAGVYRTRYAQDPEAALKAARLGGYLLAADLHDMGINVNCAPCLDLGLVGMSEVIGDRAFGDDVETIVALASAFMAGQAEAGVVSIAKHLPGHGRARVDSHVELPVVEAAREQLEATDFEVFKRLNDTPLGMTGHLKFTAIDAENVSTFSPIVMQRVIRQHIGFSGAIMSDDLSMHALSGDFASRARLSLAAGCDLILHCNGDSDEMQAIMHGVEAWQAADEAAQQRDGAFARIAGVNQLLADLPKTLDAAQRAAAQQDWGELIGKIFPDALNAV